jgi:hypothetical protein
MTTSVLILQLAVLGVVLESDLGRRKVGWFRVLRPVIAVVLIVPFFFTSLPTSGHDLLLQGAGALTGILLGLFCMSPWFVSVGWEPAWRGRFGRSKPRGAAVSQAGAGYAAVWIVVTAVRLWFAYASQHEFPHQLGQFLVAHQLSATALTNAFIFLSIGMDLFRSVLLYGRARRVRRPAVAAAPDAGAPAGPSAAAGTPAAAEPSTGRSWASDLLAVPAAFVAGRLNRQLNRPLNRAEDRLARRQDRRGRRRL